MRCPSTPAALFTCMSGVQTQAALRRALTPLLRSMHRRCMGSFCSPAALPAPSALSTTGASCTSNTNCIGNVRGLCFLCLEVDLRGERKLRR